MADQQTGAAESPPQPAPAQPRESQVQNAVAFLSHPKVQASSVPATRAFLERKGLTEAEIDEAFMRVPGSASAPEAAAASSSSAPPAVPSHPTGGSGGPHTLQAQAPPPPVAPPPPSSVRWTQVLLGASIVAAGAWAVQHWAAPYVTSLYHRAFSSSDQDGQEKEPSPEQAALTAASQELQQSVEALGQVSKAMQQALEAQQAPAEVAELLRQELRDMSSMLRMTLQTRQQHSETAEIQRELEWLKASIQPGARPGPFPGGVAAPGSSQPGSGNAAWPASVSSTPGSVSGEGWHGSSSQRLGANSPDHYVNVDTHPHTPQP